METQRRQVVLYGDSLILAGVQASLSASRNLEIITLDPALEGAQASLRGLHPAAVIFDRGSAVDIPLAFVQQPGLLLIGVDPSSSEMLVLSGRSTRVCSAADLDSLIREQDTLSEIHPQEMHGKEFQAT